MHKYSFKDDYSEGAHPRILELLTKTNMDQEIGYGEDSLTSRAVDLIRTATNNEDADVHFVSGGTQANLIVLAALMKPYESVISATSAHINIHEAGAIEATGHRINAIQSEDGKIPADKIQKIVDEHEDEHMVKPKVVFVSKSTEAGTVYKKVELESLSSVSRDNNLYLYLDGARLGSALCSKGSDLLLPDICELVDVFYIGGTKNGALLGEAIVINNDELKVEFRRHMKQRGALLAKGRVLGAQFAELFKDDLFFDLAKHANELAEKLSNGVKELGYSFLTASTTNQIFPIFPNSLIEKLEKMYGFYKWCEVDNKSSAIRLVTSWATKGKAVTVFLDDLQTLQSKQEPPNPETE